MSLPYTVFEISVRSHDWIFTVTWSRVIY